ncbi:universal stress protein [Pedobacter caeni]|uniref:Nucleotide-binding universal stress protein, UspA family n=1 Tax=Pedobacter caeni TaxID=288992 RepID=A0A1M5BC36_9SPHI|nr:universal stress protein [Pedobacter caeni]SHF40089.1 Nucleotide-binding universal stress protein, UspA family [Pedobacter caeni]
MKTILVPTDFSECADNALNFAIGIAKLSQLEIVVVHVLDLAETIYIDYAGPTVEYVKILREQAYEEMTKLKNRVMADDQIPIQTVVYESPVYGNIVQAGIDHHATLVVMGTKGANKLNEKLWGTYTASIISKSLIPVLAIPKDYKWLKPEKILLATNHFEKDEESWATLNDIIELFQVKLHVAVFTNEKKDKALTAVEHNRAIQSYSAYLDQRYHLQSVSENIYGSDFEQAMEDYIMVNGIDILVMFSHRRSFLESLFDPSKTRRMSYHIKIPLLAMPSKTGNV